MRKAISFPPLSDASATTLVLGTMPGQASLAARQYYAHPRNAFWPIMGELFGAGPQLDYDTRVARLLAGGVAVWDVLDSCVRPGSLDADIEKEGRVANHFGDFFLAHPGIVRVFFNGATAARLFRLLVLPGLSAPATACRLTCLPSTSPAHANMRFAQKLDAWRALLPTMGSGSEAAKIQ